MCEIFINHALKILLVLAIVVIFTIITLLIVDEKRFAIAPTYEVKCTLLSQTYEPCSFYHGTAPILTSNGQMGIAVTCGSTTEKTITVWDCGKFGRLPCKRKDVFKYAKDISILLIRSDGNRAEIIGIRKDRI